VKLFRINSLGTLLRALLGWPLLATGLYFAAALIGSLIPVNGDWQPSQQGYTIYLHNNGIHTSIIVPSVQDRTDLGRFFPATHLPGNPEPAHYLMFGWGDRDFYLNTPTWGDISPRIAASALVGSGESLLHVDHLDRLPAGVREIRVEHEAYQAIIGQIVQSAGPEPQPIKGYGADDAFYRAQGRDYSILYTCNNWVSDILEKAGIKTGVWTPMAGGVMRWY
jgi:uncharacterized protein (TIGR02117 family)